MQRLILVGVAVLVIAAGAVVVVIKLVSKGEGTPAVSRAEPKAYSAPPQAEVVRPPSIRFRDSTRDSGITFRHEHGGFGKKLLPETMGAGVVIFDFDGDSNQDLFLVNSNRWGHHTYDTSAAPIRCALYQNDGRGRFMDVTEALGLGNLACYGMGAAAGDIDNDGYPELLVTALNRVYLLHNEKGKGFKDITDAAGLKCPGWSTAAAFLDYDLDGRLDLFIAHYVKWTPETDLFCRLVGSEKSYCQPMLYEGEHCQLFRNLGEGRFEDVSSRAGIQVMDIRGAVPASKALGVAVHDYNDDGWPDIAVANDTTPNFLFHNNGDGTFRNLASPKGVELLNDTRGTARGAMGIHWGYYRDGETLGLVVANFANEPNGLLRYNKARDMFRDCAVAEGIDGPSRLPLKFGLILFDYDLDGRLDLFTSNGHIEPEIERIQSEVKYAQPAQLFWNAGATEEQRKQGCYREVGPTEAGEALFQPRVGRGCATGDLDGDGDLDIALNNNNQPAALLLNDCPSTQKVVRLRLRGVTANRDAVGARVKLWAGGRMQQAELNPSASYLSQHEMVLTFGLGEASLAEKVEIRWPTRSGQVTRLDNLAADHVYVVDEQNGIVDRRPLVRGDLN